MAAAPLIWIAILLTAVLPAAKMIYYSVSTRMPFFGNRTRRDCPVMWMRIDRIMIFSQLQINWTIRSRKSTLNTRTITRKRSTSIYQTLNIIQAVMRWWHLVEAIKHHLPPMARRTMRIKCRECDVMTTPRLPMAAKFSWNYAPVKRKRCNCRAMTTWIKHKQQHGRRTIKVHRQSNDVSIHPTARTTSMSCRKKWPTYEMRNSSASIIWSAGQSIPIAAEMLHFKYFRLSFGETFRRFFSRVNFIWAGSRGVEAETAAIRVSKIPLNNCKQITFQFCYVAQPESFVVNSTERMMATRAPHVYDNM